MTDSPASARPRRLLLPNLIGGLVVGALLSASLVPLLGAERSTVTSAGGQTPEFLQNSTSGGGIGAAPSTTPGSAPVVPENPGTNSTGAGGNAAGTGAGSAGATGGNTSGASTGGGGATGAGSGGRSDVPRTASDVGITKDVIKFGAITLKCDNCKAIGIQSADEAPIAKAFEKDLNARGGINGRRVQIATADYDPVNDALGGGGSSREACLKLTQQDKVFAVAGGSLFANACIYDEHKTPLITERDAISNDPTSFNRSGGRLWTMMPSPTRTLLDWARQTARLKLLPAATTKFGIVVAEGDNTSKINAVFVPELKRLRYTPTRVAVLPADPGTIAVKASQEVAAMKAAGVTHVFMAGDYFVAAGFVREAERNNFRPQYLASDFPTAGQTFVGDQAAMAGSSWNGAIALSVALDGTLEMAQKSPQSKECFDRYRKAGGGEVNNVNYGPVFGMCVRFDRLVDAAKRAGVNPTRNSLVQALASTGTFTVELFAGGHGTWGGRYSLGAVRYSAGVVNVRKVWKPAPCPYDPDVWTRGCYVVQGTPFNMAA